MAPIYALPRSDGGLGKAGECSIAEVDTAAVRAIFEARLSFLWARPYLLERNNSLKPLFVNTLDFYLTWMNCVQSMKLEKIQSLVIPVTPKLFLIEFAVSCSTSVECGRQIESNKKCTLGNNANVVQLANLLGK